MCQRGLFFGTIVIWHLFEMLSLCLEQDTTACYDIGVMVGSFVTRLMIL